MNFNEQLKYHARIHSELKQMSCPYDREVSKTKFGKITSITRRFLLKDRGVRSRILYAGKKVI